MEIILIYLRNIMWYRNLWCRNISIYISIARSKGKAQTQFFCFLRMTILLLNEILILSGVNFFDMKKTPTQDVEDILILSKNLMQSIKKGNKVDYARHVYFRR